MHCLSPKMVCETKIVAEDHESIPGSKKDTIIVSSSQMWPSLAGSPPSPPPPLTPPKEDPRRDNVYIREFHPSEQEVVRRIFYEGIMERIPNTAFRGLKQQPLTQLLYGLLAGEYPLPFGAGGGFIGRRGCCQDGRRGGRTRGQRRSAERSRGAAALRRGRRGGASAAGMRVPAGCSGRGGRGRGEGRALSWLWQGWGARRGAQRSGALWSPPRSPERGARRCRRCLETAGPSSERSPVWGGGTGGTPAPGASRGVTSAPGVKRPKNSAGKVPPSPWQQSITRAPLPVAAIINACPPPPERSGVGSCPRWLQGGRTPCPGPSRAGGSCRL